MLALIIRHWALEEFLPMELLRRLFGGAPRSPAEHTFSLYVRCARCATPVAVHIDVYNDLAVEYAHDTVVGYTLRKRVMDTTCFQFISTYLRFDPDRREVSRSIEGGAFISRQEYEQLLLRTEGAA